MDGPAGIVWSSISREDLQEMEASSKETHGILDELISTIPKADIHVLFTEVEEGGLKASMRSSASIDCSRLAAETYGGGGHPRASGFRVKTYENFQLQVLECIKKLKEGMERQRKEAEEVPRSIAAPLVPSVPAKATPRSRSGQAPATKGTEGTKVTEEKRKPAKGSDIVKKLSNGADGKGKDVLGEITEM